MQSEPIHILITGANGQLGQSFGHIADRYPEFQFHLLTRSDFDITQPPSPAVTSILSRISAIINCAAYTQVEKAEDEPDMAFQCNALGVEKLGELCKTMQIPLIHFSTDYVFDGTQDIPYTELSQCNPLSAYGQSKRTGEERLEKIQAPHLTLRVSWLYSTFGQNFYRAILHRAAQQGFLKVVNDQVASPTFATHLAEDVLQLIRQIVCDKAILPYGIYHYEQSGEASWYDFAQAIIDGWKMEIPIHPVTTEEFPMKAQRPAYSKLNGTKIRKLTHLPSRSWQDGVTACIVQDKEINYRKSI